MTPQNSSLTKGQTPDSNLGYKNGELYFQFCFKLQIHSLLQVTTLEERCTVLSCLFHISIG